MNTSPLQECSERADVRSARGRGQRDAHPTIEVGLLTGGSDRPYVFGLATALAAKGVHLDVIGSDAVYRPELDAPPQLTFLNLRGDQQGQASLGRKVGRILKYYARLMRYAWTAKPKVFHILWNNKFLFFDRTVLMLYYKLHGKKIVLTAHNVNAARRDGKDSFLNRISLKIQYRLTDHIFVHTEKMKEELVEEFGVPNETVTVIPFGINNSVPDSELTSAEAKRCLGIASGSKAILFFGRIRPYKGLEFLIAAFREIARLDNDYRLIIAGEAQKGSEAYLRQIRSIMPEDTGRDRILQKIEFIPDGETEVYFKAADVLVLPYIEIFQSGVLFLAYNFGLPVIAANVGSFRDDVIPGETGFLCQSCDPADLASAIMTYFESDLFKDLDRRRPEIRDHALARNSWDVVGDKTCAVYGDLLDTSVV
jgi:glycosyltransferase involved in cell wall biosynthesis